MPKRAHLGTCWRDERHARARLLPPGAENSASVTAWECRNTESFIEDPEALVRLRGNLIMGLQADSTFSGADCFREALQRQVNHMDAHFNFNLEPGPIINYPAA